MIAPASLAVERTIDLCFVYTIQKMQSSILLALNLAISVVEHSILMFW